MTRRKTRQKERQEKERDEKEQDTWTAFKTVLRRSTSARVDLSSSSRPLTADTSSSCGCEVLSSSLFASCTHTYYTYIYIYIYITQSRDGVLTHELVDTRTGHVHLTHAVDTCTHTNLSRARAHDVSHKHWTSGVDTRS